MISILCPAAQAAGLQSKVLWLVAGARHKPRDAEAVTLRWATTPPDAMPTCTRKAASKCMGRRSGGVCPTASAEQSEMSKFCAGLGTSICVEHGDIICRQRMSLKVDKSQTAPQIHPRTPPPPGQRCPSMSTWHSFRETGSKNRPPSRLLFCARLACHKDQCSADEHCRSQRAVPGGQGHACRLRFRGITQVARVPMELQARENMRVSFTKNMNKDSDYVNGMGGTVLASIALASGFAQTPATSSWSSPGLRSTELEVPGRHDRAPFHALFQSLHLMSAQPRALDGRDNEKRESKHELPVLCPHWP